jgi:hypothetical protein
MDRWQPGQAVLKQGDGALGPAQFDPGGRALDLDVRQRAVAPGPLVPLLLAALRELGCGIQRLLTRDLVAGQGVPDRHLLQRDRAATAGEPAPMLQGGLREPDGPRHVAGGCSLIRLPDQHIGHHERVAGLLGPLHRPVGPMRARPSVAAVLVEPARELGIARADLQQAAALGAGKVGEQLLDEVQVAADGSEDLMGTQQPVGGAQLRECSGEVLHNLAGMGHRNDRRSLQRCPFDSASGGEGTEDLKDGTPVHLISPQLLYEHVHRLRQLPVHR